MTNNGNAIMLALKKRSLQTYKDMLAVLELQAAGLGAYAPAGKILELERAKQQIAALEEEISDLEAEDSEGDNPGQPNHGKRKYVDALVDMQVEAVRTRLAVEEVGAKVTELTKEVRRSTGRLDGIEGYLRASDAVRDTVRFGGGG